MKSNIEKSLIPMSLAKPTTSKFVDVPIVVDIPPMIAAKPIGIMTFDTEILYEEKRPPIWASINNDWRVVHEST